LQIVCNFSSSGFLFDKVQKFIPQVAIAIREFNDKSRKWRTILPPGCRGAWRQNARHYTLKIAFREKTR
jgi:hypothetical protein